jgi:hypothetical protein
MSEARIDTGALRRKYARERDKRLRPDGNGQYLRLTGEFRRYLDDPYTPLAERAPIAKLSYLCSTYSVGRIRELDCLPDPVDRDGSGPAGGGGG